MFHCFSLKIQRKNQNLYKLNTHDGWFYKILTQKKTRTKYESLIVFMVKFLF